MNTLIINGSPNADRGNTVIFMRQFASGCAKPYEIAYAVKENPAALAERMKTFDAVLFFLPMYVFSMPGVVMKLIEHMDTAQPGQSIGFVVQYGFIEGSQAQYVKRYFELLAKRLRYQYIGTIVRGNSAGIGYMPERMNQKLFRKLRALGKKYGDTGLFDSTIEMEFEKPYRLSKAAVLGLRFITFIGLNNIFWHKMLRDNKAFEKRLDRPFESIE